MGEQAGLRSSEPVIRAVVASPNGGVAVRTTERGLPTHLKIGAAEMSRAPEELAREILFLCRLSGMRLQVARRRALLSRGFSTEVIRGVNLATEEDLAKAEQEARGDDDEPPETVLRPT